MKRFYDEMDSIISVGWDTEKVLLCIRRSLSGTLVYTGPSSQHQIVNQFLV